MEDDRLISAAKALVDYAPMTDAARNVHTRDLKTIIRRLLERIEGLQNSTATTHQQKPERYWVETQRGIWASYLIRESAELVAARLGVEVFAGAEPPSAAG